MSDCNLGLLRMCFCLCFCTLQQQVENDIKSHLDTIRTEGTFLPSLVLFLLLECCADEQLEGKGKGETAQIIMEEVEAIVGRKYDECLCM
jgi:hypothetical protein